MYQPTLAGVGTPETRPGPRPRPSRPLPFTLRIAEQPAPIAGAPALHSSAEVVDFMRPRIGSADRETFVILHLDTKNQLLDAELHAIGDVDSSAVYPRQVLRSAILRNSAALIFCHNHPSGDPEPSLCDRQLTRDLVAAAALVQIKVHDHIILGRDCHFSMADKGLIDDYAFTAQGLGLIHEDPYDCDDRDGYLIDGVGFADPGGRSALRAATRRNPRNLPCPTCREPNRLTPLDRARGYQCDECADRAEGLGD